jgi:hypothetical protein
LGGNKSKMRDLNKQLLVEESLIYLRIGNSLSEKPFE